MTNAPSGLLFAGLPPGTGYGNATRDYLALLDNEGIAVRWVPLQYGSPVWGPDYYAAPSPVPLPPHVNNARLQTTDMSPAVALFHTPREFWPKLRAAHPVPRTLIYTTFEQTVLPQETVRSLNSFDGVLVPSRFNFEFFRASGVEIPMWVVPHVVMPPAAKPPETPPDDLPRQIGPETFVVSVVGPWQSRKAIAASIEAYLRAFGPDDDTLLVVKTGAHDHVAKQPSAISIAQILGRHGRTARLHLISGDLRYSQLMALVRRSDCSLSLTRGEGFGLTIAEAISQGTPVITTGWGAPPEFLGKDYPLLVDYAMIAVASEPTDGWADTCGDWASADIDHAASLLRWVRDHREEARNIVSRAQEQLVATCGPLAVKTRLLDALGDLRAC